MHVRSRHQSCCGSLLSAAALRTCGEGGPVDWRLAADHSHLRQLIAQIVPGWEKIGAIDTTKEEFHLEDRLLHRPAFKTASGKAIFKAQMRQRGKISATIYRFGGEKVAPDFKPY